MQYCARCPHHSATTGRGLIKTVNRIIVSRRFGICANGELIDFRMIRYGDVVTRLGARNVFPVHVALQTKLVVKEEKKHICLHTEHKYYITYVTLVRPVSVAFAPKYGIIV